MFNLYLLKVFRSIYDPYKPLKARQIFGPKRKQQGAPHTQVFMVHLFTKLGPLPFVQFFHLLFLHELVQELS